ncbi:biotin-dependent carboxyltransferase family protein [Ekhidna sp.]|uniref:5-oxoprolinase subunit C family protein n=1 Tax=Ekhidna sp. TaxID=2608089 RepID=UPI003CCB7675
MGKIRITKTGPLTSIQDFGRFGFRRYGIPQSGAMDKEFMIVANQLAGNPNEFPVIEFAMSGIECEVLEDTFIATVGADLMVNDERSKPNRQLRKGDQVKISAPEYMYGYLALSGLLSAKQDFGSFSTYQRAGFGGIEGRNIRKGDMVTTSKHSPIYKNGAIPNRGDSGVTEIRIMKGPEWELLKELPASKVFQIDASSDRMGVRLKGANLECDYHEIASSAVIPGTIQLPPDGQPIILMNDCQTTGGYPRIGKVVDEDLSRIAQIRVGKEVIVKMKDD